MKTVKCDSCGTEVSISSRFCPACGNKMSRQTKKGKSKNAIRVSAVPEIDLSSHDKEGIFRPRHHASIRLAEERVVQHHILQVREKLTPSFLQDVLSPYIMALSDLQAIINEMRGIQFVQSHIGEIRFQDDPNLVPTYELFPLEDSDVISYGVSTLLIDDKQEGIPITNVRGEGRK